MQPWVLFDDGSEDLAPLCDLRASFELRTGAMTTIERLTEQVGSPPAALVVPAGLHDLVASRHSVPVNVLPAADAITFISGRCTKLELSLPDAANTAQIDHTGNILALRLDRRMAGEWMREPSQLPEVVATVTAEDAKSLSRPWDVLRRCGENLADDLVILSKRLQPLRVDASLCITVVGEHPVFAGETSVVHPHVVFDTSAGPIVVDEGAAVRSMSVVVGPVYVGKESIVCNHAHIRAGTVIGPGCKVGGEVNACLFQGLSNKAHSGYFGNSFVGEWVNLGASTVTSNLKNTYGEVRMQLDPTREAEPTRMKFLGSIIGDHVKTSIGTRLLTGSCLHTGAMIAVSRFPPKCVPRFAFLMGEGAEDYDLAKFLAVAGAVMGRRGVKVDRALRERIEWLHAKHLAG